MNTRSMDAAALEASLEEESSLEEEEESDEPTHEHPLFQMANMLLQVNAPEKWAEKRATMTSFSPLALPQNVSLPVEKKTTYEMTADDVEEDGPTAVLPSAKKTADESAVLKVKRPSKKKPKVVRPAKSANTRKKKTADVSAVVKVESPFKKKPNVVGPLKSSNARKEKTADESAVVKVESPSKKKSSNTDIPVSVGPSKIKAAAEAAFYVTCCVLYALGDLLGWLGWLFGNSQTLIEKRVTESEQKQNKINHEQHMINQEQGKHNKSVDIRIKDTTNSVDWVVNRQDEYEVALNEQKDRTDHLERRAYINEQQSSKEISRLSNNQEMQYILLDDFSKRIEDIEKKNVSGLLAGAAVAAVAAFVAKIVYS